MYSSVHFNNFYPYLSVEYVSSQSFINVNTKFPKLYTNTDLI